MQPMTAGLVSALVGFTSSFVVVLAGFEALGASAYQASSGLLTVSISMGLCSILLAYWTRMPISVAWSTPGAALLATTAAVDGGWPAAVGAFLVTGVLILLTGLIAPLGALIASIPPSIAQAMLAGILFQLCLGPILGLVENPLAVAPVILIWLLTMRFLPRWAAPLAFLTAAIVIGIHLSLNGEAVEAASLIPRVEFTAPAFTLSGVIGIALPLYLVTMASQNVPGVAVMKGLGYQVPWRRSMLVTGTATLLGAPSGGHAVNLAAISAALAAGEEAGADRSKRWIASVTAGGVYVLLGIGAAALGTLVSLAPVGVIAAVAGLALLSTFAASLKAALTEPGEEIAAAITFITAASGIAILGISAAFWALIAGLTVRLVLKRTR